MNARERLQHIMNHPNYRRSVMEPEGSTSYDGHEDAAALRELDQLLSSFVSIEREQHHGREDKFSTHGPCDICDLVIRAAQAGYREK